MLNSLEAITALEDAHTSGAYPKRPLAIVRGRGCTVWDEQGNAYLDATAGQGVAVLGHSHPALAAAITQQANTLITCPEIFYNDQRARLYDHLTAILPDEIGRFFLCNSGAEAIEGALKAARLLTGRSHITATRRAFHGRTLGAVSLTWNKKYREPFDSWGINVTHVTYNDIDAARETVTPDTAAIVVEAVQGEGGVYPADDTYLQALRQLSDETGALLIVDEIQAGMGRTGRWFAFEHAGIVPDIVTLGKGIAGGVPMGAVGWRSALGELPRSSHGSTFGGNPLACAASIATITTIQQEALVERAAVVGEHIRSTLAQAGLEAVREIRGRGLMIGIELRGRVTPILKALQDEGVLALPAGLNVLRLLPPLVITDEEVERLLAALQRVLGEGEQGSS